MVPMQPRTRRRGYFVRGRHVPFEGYRRARRASTSEADASDNAAMYLVGGFGPESGLTSAQAWLAQQRLTLAIQRRRQQGQS